MGIAEVTRAIILDANARHARAEEELGHDRIVTLGCGPSVSFIEQAIHAVLVQRDWELSLVLASVPLSCRSFAYDNEGKVDWVKSLAESVLLLGAWAATPKT